MLHIYSYRSYTIATMQGCVFFPTKDTYPQGYPRFCRIFSKCTTYRPYCTQPVFVLTREIQYCCVFTIDTLYRLVMSLAYPHKGHFPTGLSPILSLLPSSDLQKLLIMKRPHCGQTRYPLMQKILVLFHYSLCYHYFSNSGSFASSGDGK